MALASAVEFVDAASPLKNQWPTPLSLLNVVCVDDDDVETDK